MTGDNHSLGRVLQAANQMADAAGEAIMPYFRQAPTIDNKAGGHDFDPVTEADRGAERAIRAVIGQHFPDDGIFGEEYGQHAGRSGYSWILDPIDGTRSFITGVPQWGTLIALHDGHRAVFGMMDQPFLRERYVGSADGAYWSASRDSSHPLKVRACENLEAAVLMSTCPHLFSGGPLDAFEQVRARVSLTRYGGDCYSYCMLAAGHIDLVIETGLNAYDIQALVPIIEAAGGIVTNWAGGDMVAGGDVIAAGDRRCHAEALEIMRQTLTTRNS